MRARRPACVLWSAAMEAGTDAAKPRPTRRRRRRQAGRARHGGGLWGLLAGLCLLLGLGAACSPEPFRVPEDISVFYGALQQDARAFKLEGGDWKDDLGDAPFYGTAFYTRAAATSMRPDYAEIARSAKTRNLAFLQEHLKNRADLDQFLGNLEEIMMSGLGLIEHAAQTGDLDALPELEQLIDTLDALAVGQRLYIDYEAGMFAIRTYGPTAITAGVALLNVQYAKYFQTEHTAERLELVRRMLDTIDEKAWTGSIYRVRPGEDLLELYPNTMMMLVLTRLYEITQDPALLARAEAVFAGIAPLKNAARGGYNSPYSAKAMGAKTDDYSTLSSQNYLTLTLMLMYESTQKRQYLDEAAAVLEFVRGHLYDAASGRVLHHYIDGRVALPTDPEFFCSGCNLQLLYVLWYLNERIQPTLGAAAPATLS